MQTGQTPLEMLLHVMWFSVRAELFRRRCNRDGTYDSICLSCFLTVAHGQSEFDSERLELLHVCSGVVGMPGGMRVPNDRLAL